VKYILDTNTVSFLMRGDAAVRGRLMSHARTDVFIPAPVVAEIEYGIARLPRSARRSHLRTLFDVLLAELERFEWDDGVSRSFGEIKASLERRGTVLEDMDIAVAAHAVAAQATLVTDNTAHMNRIPDLRVENWRR